MRLRGKGLPTLRSASRGDQLLHLFVETPTKLTGPQRELLEQFAAASDMKVSPAHKGFLEGPHVAMALVTPSGLKALAYPMPFVELASFGTPAAVTAVLDVTPSRAHVDMRLWR